MTATKTVITCYAVEKTIGMNDWGLVAHPQEGPYVFDDREAASKFVESSEIMGLVELHGSAEEIITMLRRYATDTAAGRPRGSLYIRELLERHGCGDIISHAPREEPVAEPANESVEAPTEETVQPDSGTLPSIPELRMKCDSLGIKWHHRHKAESLQRMIDEHK